MFELITSAGALFDALKAIAPVIEKRNTIPILSCCRFADGRVAGTDLDLEIETQFAVSKFEGEICVDHGTLWRLTRYIPRDAQITMRANEAGGVDIDFEGGSYTLPSLPASDWSSLTGRMGLASEWNCSNAALARVFKQVSHSISTEETRYYLNGVCLTNWAGADSAESSPCVVSTDGHRMTVVDVPGADGFADQILPRKAVSIVCALGNPQTLRFQADELALQFAWPGMTLTTKLIDGSFPDFGRVIPKPDSAVTQITLPANEAGTILSRLDALHAERSRATKIAIEGDSVFLSAGSSQHGTGREQVRTAEVSKPLDLKLGLNAHYLRDQLRIMPDDVPLSIQDEKSPVAAFGDGITAVLMPLRV